MENLPAELKNEIFKYDIIGIRRTIDDTEERMGQEARNITHARHQLQIANMNPFGGLGLQLNQALHQNTINQATNRFNNLREERNTLHNRLGNMRVLSRNI
jgi:hypothetical protein